MIRSPYILILICLAFVSCSGEDQTSEDMGYGFKPDNNSSELVNADFTTVKIAESQKKIIGGYSFGCKEVTALDYLTKIGKIPSIGDQNDLRKESVVMLEIGAKKGELDVFESKELKMSPDDVAKYLLGEIMSDFSISQGTKTIYANGVQSEGKIGSGDKLRVTFFVSDLDLSKSYTIEYYDRIFGKGLIKMKKTNNELISKL